MKLSKRIKEQIRPIARSWIEHDRTLMNQMMADWARKKGWRPLGIDTEDYLAVSFGYDDEANIKQAVSIVRHNTMVSFERLATLWAQVQYLDKHRVEGALVECGVWRGGAAGLMALAHRQAQTLATRHLHLFDSWEGLPEPKAEFDGPRAVEYAGGASEGSLKPISRCVAGLDEVRELLEARIGYPPELLHYHVGWFQETLAQAQVGPIALLCLDGDWYESTKLCLDQLYSKVVKGGIVVLDDYGFWSGCRKATDEFIEQLAEPVMLHRIDAAGRYFIKQ